MEDPNQAMGVAVRSLLKSQSLSPSLREHITRTDVDGDGMISVDELLKVLEAERSLRRERKLLIRIMIALGVACMLIIAAVVGLTYAVVHLSKDTNVKNNVLVSKDTSEAISTASMQVTYPLKDWYKVQSTSELEGLTQITVPFGDGISIFTIQDIHLVPNESVRFDTWSENVSITVSESGVFVSGDENNSTASRRRLMSSGEPEGTVSGQVVGRSTGNNGQLCSNDNECETGKCEGVITIQSIVAWKGTCTKKDTLPTGSVCESGSDYKRKQCSNDNECETGKCEGVITIQSIVAWKGTCTRKCKLPTGSVCESDSDCKEEGDRCRFTTYMSGKGTKECVNCPGSSAFDGMYCQKRTKTGNPCLLNEDLCESGFCMEVWRTPGSPKTDEGICSPYAQLNEPCGPIKDKTSNYECENQVCGRATAEEGAALVCCPSGTTITYGGYDYCTKMTVGATCWTDDMCETGKCKGNGGGMQKGTCSSTTKAAGESCESNYECANQACGRPTAAEGAELVCCPSGTTTTYAGYDYCKGMTQGATCWSDAMCQSGFCKGNGWGIQKGTCQFS